MMTRIFVYGTLKRGCCRNDVLMGDFVSEVITMPNYKMYDVGGFPALVEDPNGIAIHGELWDVGDMMLSILDMIEGVARGLYKRCIVNLSNNEKAIAYLWQLPVNGLSECGDTWRE